jgi:hypothetical protein
MLLLMSNRSRISKDYKLFRSNHSKYKKSKPGDKTPSVGDLETKNVFFQRHPPSQFMSTVQPRRAATQSP